jgi:hypothetical protein
MVAMEPLVGLLVRVQEEGEGGLQCAEGQDQSY